MLKYLVEFSLKKKKKKTVNFIALNRQQTDCVNTVLNKKSKIKFRIKTERKDTLIIILSSLLGPHSLSGSKVQAKAKLVAASRCIYSSQ